MIINVFNNIEELYPDIETRKRKINQTYKIWIRDWKGNYGQLVNGLTILTDKSIEWENKNEEMSKIYKNLIKKLRKHMKKLETTI